MSADPVVSPADTIRRALWHSETCRYKTGCECGYCAAQDALAALLAVGERDRRQIARLTERVELLEVLGEQAVDTIEFLHGCLTEPHEDGTPGGYEYAYPEQTEQRLAGLRRFLPEREVCVHSKFVPGCQGCIDGEHAREVMGRAVLAGEEDARP